MQDLLLKQTPEGYFDFVLGEQDFKTVLGMETTVAVLLFTDARASATEQQDALLRRGWVGNIFRDIDLGSLIWLISQERNTQEIRNKLKSYIENALQPLIDDSFATDVDVVVTEDGTRGAKASIDIKVNNSNTQKFNFWLDTNLGNLELENVNNT